jgi:hypothetical protein
MTTHFDDKGKFFTPIITKVPVAVIIQTTVQKIEGKIHIRPDERIKDEMDRPEAFLAVTDATIFNADGTQMISSHFLTLNRAQIIWIIPVEELASQT